MRGAAGPKNGNPMPGGGVRFPAEGAATPNTGGHCDGGPGAGGGPAPQGGSLGGGGVVVILIESNCYGSCVVAGVHACM
eukprot:11190187-Lingulodinium_polyedra.AAC.3